MLETTLLAILQGIAEFLPISSSGHLVIAQELLGVNAPGMRLDIMLHVGTLLSICVFYWTVLWRIFRTFDVKYMVNVIVSAVPAVIVYFLFRHQLEAAFEDPRMVGCALLVTGVILLITRFLPQGMQKLTLGKALLMGLAQACALVPGISRSGSTLVAARCAEVESAASAEFSFLMSAPLIAGAALMEIVKAVFSTEPAAAGEISWIMSVYGALVAAAVGYFALKFLLKSLKSKWFWLFGPYCLLAGAVVLVVNVI